MSDVVTLDENTAALETALALGGLAFNEGTPVTPESAFALEAVLQRRGVPTTDAEIVDFVNDVRRAYNGLVR